MLPARVAIAVLAAAIGSSAVAQPTGPVEISPAVSHDALPSLRNTIPQADGYQRWHERDERLIPLPYFPPGQADGALQSSARRSPLAPTLQTAVDGVGDGFSGPGGSFTVRWVPPDTVGAVGATQYLQVVNDGLAVFDKATKSVVYGPVPSNTLWAGFGGQCEADNDGDAIVVYDKAANRWVVSQFAVGTTPYLECVAVSQTSDATGGWYRYAFSYGSVFPDYPKMGVWPDGYYVTFNMFNGNPFVGAKLCAYDRANMLAGTAATQQCFQLSSSYGGVLPSDLDGSAAPPQGAPNYLLNFGSNSLNLWKFHVDWATPANTTLTGPANLAVAAFTPACASTVSGVCVPQSGTQQSLDSLGDRLMYRLAYRNFGDHESLVVNHSVTVGTAHKNLYTGVRWYEIRSPNATPVIYQQSTFSPDASYRWMGSIAMDGAGNMALGYSVSSSTLFPSISYTGRLDGDALNTMQAETTMVAGGGAQTGADRWGDYSAMTIDPVDDCTFWFTTEYVKTDGAPWRTRIGSLKFPTCGAAKQDQTISFTSTAPAGATAGGSAYIVTATATSGLGVALTVAAGSASVCALGGSASGSSVSFIGAGTCTINANQSGNSNYNAAPQVQQSFGVGKGGQSISFTSSVPASATYQGSAYTVTAAATSGLPVSLTIDAAAATVCSLDGSVSGSHVSFIGVGTCTIDADQAGNANYLAAAQKQQSFAVGQAAQAISFDSTAPSNASAGGATYQVLASATSGLPVSLAIDAAASTVCVLDGSTSGSNVSFIGAGVCKIDATQSGDANHAAAAPQQQSFAVVPGPAAQLVFTTQPGDVVAGSALATIAVTEKDALGDVIDDSGSVVTFSVAACSGDIVIGSATMAHGIATLDSLQRFYTVTDPATLKVSAATGALGADSAGFVVMPNGDLSFADGFEGCRL